ncbi:hypothetical protein [Arcticibacterium luteifluviistationis]|uniref:Uncharacterized protein n=1 Tax=Arcticibacterium luteifluviistationis TaxID=1784714 RepID=A0A2Z4GBE1_9BACT|nr:hypothetical protein [Arcticibacterium luteifluviistationis]AWV98360.1 hypothetical protein DJ013_09320 [Arcticibacterium luteifluviistationis]
MDTNLISHIEQFQNHYLIISGIYSNKTLSILDGNLNQVKEYKFENIQIWGADFHHIESTKILISVYTTHTTELKNWKYQGFNTHWFEIEINHNQFSFTKLTIWEKSDIRRILSYEYNNSLNWVALRDLNYQHQREKTGKKSVINFETQTNQKSIPELKTSILVTKYLDLNADILVHNDELYLSAISLGAPYKCNLFKFNFENDTTLIQNFDVPLYKWHHYLSNKLVIKNNQIFAYYWTTSHEPPSPKYKFEIYKTGNLNSSVISKETERLIESEFTHAIIWNNPDILAYRKDNESNRKYFSEIDSNGFAVNERHIEDWFPIHFGYDSDMICLDKEMRNVKLIKSKS